ncbi:MAG: kynureninase [Granulosicoccus sp.]|jgi:kynureninase
MRTFNSASEIWRDVPEAQLWAKHKALGNLMIDLLEPECGPLGVTVNTPRDDGNHGGHVGFSHAGAGQVCEALLEAGVVGPFRQPNALRFGLGALHLSCFDVWVTVSRLRDILETVGWRGEISEGIGLA